MGRRLRFGPFEVDQDAQVVLRDGVPLPVGQRGVLLLQALLGRPGEVVTKSELLDAAWGGAVVEESNLSVQVAALRKALGSTADGGEWIATISRVGYRLVAPSSPTPPGADEPARPSIAVLPFDNLSSDPEQGYFADGISEDIIIGLSKLSGLRVMVRNASFAYRGPGIDVRTAASGLGVSHVLAGAVRRNGDRVRLSVELAEGATGTQIWGERFDRQMVDVFAMQDEITLRIVEVLKVKLGPSEAIGPSIGGTTDPEALDHLLRGRSLLNGATLNADLFRRGMDHLHRALERDPNYADALGALSLAHIHDHVNRWTENADVALQAALEAARQRLALAPHSAAAHESLSMVADFARDEETFVREAEIALSLDPNFADAPLARGKLCMNRNEPLAAIPHFEEGMRRDPSLSATIFFLQMLGMAYLYGRRFETAAALFKERILLMPQTDWSRAYLIAALGHLDRGDEARAVHAQLVGINAGYCLDERIARSALYRPYQMAIVRDGWRKAGLSTAHAGAIGT